MIRSLLTLALLLQTSGIGGSAGVGGAGGIGGGFTASASGPTVVDFCTPTVTTTPTSINCTIPTSATTGQTIWIATNWLDNHTIGCTDSLNTATLNVPASGGPYPLVWTGSANNQYYSYTVTNVTSGSHTLTCTDSNTPGSSPWMFAILINGANTSTPYDTGAALSILSGSFPGGVFTSTAFTTTSTDLAITVCAIGHNDPVSVVSPMVLVANAGGTTNILSGQSAVGAAGSHTTSCTEPFSDDVIIDVSAYKP